MMLNARQIILWLLSVVLIFITLIAYFKRTIVASGVYGASDFYKFYESALFYFSGQNIYSNVIVELKNLETLSTSWVSANGNLNPPFFTLLLLPLHIFNYAKAFQVWNFVSTVFMALGGYLVIQAFPQWRKNLLPLLSLFFLYLPNSENLAYGQITSFLLVFIGGSWLLVKNNKNILAGVLIGLACSIKLFCGLFLIYFLVIKNYRLILSALTTILISILIGGLFFGFKSYLSYHEILNHIGWYSASWNVSFYGFFIKVFSNTEKNIPLISAPYLVTIFTNIFSASLLGYLIWFWKKWGTEKLDLSFSLVIIAMLLLSPLGWLYYFPLLLIPYLVLMAQGNLAVQLISCFLLWLSTLTGNFLRPIQMKHLYEIFLLGGFGFYILLILVLLLILLGFGIGRAELDARNKISEKLWIFIYVLIFVPSLISLGAIYRDLA